jgi:type II secretory pathway pseudopilin PulG
MRGGFSYIELIISIVVVSVVVVSIPMLFSQSINATAFVVKGEGLFRADAQIKAILTHQWDHKSLDTATGFTRVLDVSAGDSALDRNGTVRGGGFSRSAGHSREYFMTTTQATLPGVFSESNATVDDVDDFNALSVDLSGVSGYLSDFFLDMNVTYVPDTANYAGSVINFALSPTPTAGTTNIKMVEVTVRGTDNQPYTKLVVFTTTIGEVDLLDKPL